jgi:hypothetical protein
MDSGSSKVGCARDPLRTGGIEVDHELLLDRTESGLSMLSLAEYWSAEAASKTCSVLVGVIFLLQGADFRFLKTDILLIPFRKAEAFNSVKE